MAGGGGIKKRFQYCTDPSGQKLFASELFKVIQDAIPLILRTGQCVDSEQFLRVHLSYWMRSQFTLHHKFKIDSGRTKF